MVKYTTYTFVEAFKIMKEKGSYARCCGYPFIFMIPPDKSYKIYASSDEGDTFGLLGDFQLMMEMCNEPFWVVSSDGLVWTDRNGQSTEYN